MFGQIIDLLVKQDEERKRIFFLILKVVFTIALAAKAYVWLIGKYSIIPITDFQKLTEYFLSGSVIICFAIFYLVWITSYGIALVWLYPIAIWASTKFYNFLTLLIKVDAKLVASEIATNKSSKLIKHLRWYLKLLNSIDIIEMENNILKPGTHFYKFYDYLLDVTEGKKIVNSDQFISVIALVIQFISIYILFDFTFLSHSGWLLLLAFIIIFFLLIFNILALILATLVEIKHKRLLIFMKTIEPEYEQLRKI